MLAYRDHPTYQALIRAIAAEPDEDTHRLALADWLQEQVVHEAHAALYRDPVVRDLIRLQIQLCIANGREEESPDNTPVPSTYTLWEFLLVVQAASLCMLFLPAVSLRTAMDTDQTRGWFWAAFTAASLGVLGRVFSWSLKATTRDR